MRVLHIIDRLTETQGGSVKAVLDICRFLAQVNVQVEVAGCVDDSNDFGHLDQKSLGFPVHKFKSSFPKRYARSQEFEQWLIKRIERYDLIEIHAIFSVLTIRAAQLCRKIGKPYYVRPHGSLDPFDLKKHALLKRIIGPMLIKPFLKGSSAVFLTAEMEATRLVTYGANVQKRILSLPVKLDEANGNRVRFRKRYNIPLDAITVLFLSRIDYKKGLEFLIPALSILRKERQDLWFILAGSGTARFVSVVRGLLKKHDVENITSEVGFVTGQDKADAFAASDVFALPSLNENFGIVNVEAMHYGLPLLISDEVYISREIEAAGAGVVCRPDSLSVYRELRALIESSVEMKAMGNRGKQLVQDQFQPSAVTETLIRNYRHSISSNLDIKPS